MKKLYFLSLFLFVMSYSFAQCGAPYIDSGGIEGDYLNNADETITFTPDNPTFPITVTFTEFITEQTFDILEVYNGDSTASPLLALLDGDMSLVTPFAFVSTHPSGALTFHFTSDNTGTDTGWSAFTTCGGAPPVNFGCSFALPITCGNTVVGDTTFSVPDNSTGFCGDFFEDNSPGVWYRLVGTGGDITLSTCSPISNFDTQIAVFSGDCNNLICIDGNDDADGGLCDAIDDLLSVVTFPSVLGESYFIYVTGFDSFELGTFELSVSCDVVSVDEVQNHNFSFSPNPVNDILYMSATKQIDEISIYNLLGQELKKISNNLLTADIDLTDLISGAYYIKVKIGDEISTHNIIKK
jgi:hypothetical protein